MSDDALDELRKDLGLEPMRDRLAPDVGTKDGLRRIMNEILADGLAVIHAAGKFNEVDPESEDWTVPEHFIKQAGGNIEAATHAYRIARYACMSPSKAPIGLKLAQERTMGILLSQARNIDDKPALQVSQVAMPPINTAFRIIKDEDGKRR